MEKSEQEALTSFPSSPRCALSTLKLDEFVNLFKRRIRRINLKRTKVIDSKEYFYDNENLVFCDDMHFNRYGTELMSSIIEKNLQKKP